ncbi:MAG TPA: DciA family protein [Steroidobacteraceae bacterium]|nr:DciA family protein [Steroidobacteraceae bacterium]
MQNPRSVSDLLSRTGNKLSALKTRSAARARIADLVRAALPAELARAVAGAEIEGSRLTVGVTGAVWASRLRYCTDALRKQVGTAAGTDIQSVRIRVVPSA